MKIQTDLGSGGVIHGSANTIAYVKLVPNGKDLDFGTLSGSEFTELRFGIPLVPLIRDEVILLYRRMVRTAMDNGFRTLVFDFGDFVHAGTYGLGGVSGGRLFAETVITAGYDFNRYKKTPKKGYKGIDYVHVTNVDADALRGINLGTVIGTRINLARDLANTAQCDMSPIDLANEAKRVGKKVGVGVTVHGVASLKKLKMGLLLAVGQGAATPPCLIEMTYWGAPTKSDAPILIVGKGICMDTGGYDLKLAGGMKDMHLDMTGGAVAIQTIAAVAEQKLPVNMVVLVPAAINAIGPKAYMTGDVITSRSGLNIHIGNTDAEGRLVLADALHYGVQKYEPAIAYTLATLTGASLIGYGEYDFPFATTNGLLRPVIEKLGAAVGNYAHPMPFRPHRHKIYLKSSKADMINVREDGSKSGSSIAGAMFMYSHAQEAGFECNRFVHMDIAAVMEVGPDEHLGGEATGQPLSLLYSLADNGIHRRL